ncbi:hypothetical protein AB0L06_29735 [Spirillospora sp. NPDC052269]
MKIGSSIRVAAVLGAATAALGAISSGTASAAVQAHPAAAQATHDRPAVKGTVIPLHGKTGARPGDASGPGLLAYHGCSSGTVCIYPDSGWNNDQPIYRFYEYGYARFYNLYGSKRVMNNQYATSTHNGRVYVCHGQYGDSCDIYINPGQTHVVEDMSSYNTLMLT